MTDSEQNTELDFNRLLFFKPVQGNHRGSTLLTGPRYQPNPKTGAAGP